MNVAKVNATGIARVLEGAAGMTFVVDEFTDGRAGKVAHVRDYRFPNERRPFQIWSISADGYDLIEEES